MRRLVMIFACIGLVFFSISSVQAEVKTYIKKTTYQAGELDTEFSSQVIAKARVKQMILDGMAKTAEGWSKSMGFPFSRDLAMPLFPCLVNIKPAKEKWKNGTYTYKATAKTDLGSVLRDLGGLTANTALTADIFANHAAGEEALREIEQINAGIASSGTRTGKQDAYNNAVNRLHASDWYERARFLMFSGKSQEAIGAYSKVIEYDEDRASAYVNRGALYLQLLDDRKLALTDLMKANQLYFNKASELRRTKDYLGCVANLNGALMARPKDADALFQRAYSDRERAGAR
ncbi:MAG: hypothetical protein V3S89_05930 [Desulfobacterales bacterium]